MTLEHTGTERKNAAGTGAEAHGIVPEAENRRIVLDANLAKASIFAHEMACHADDDGSDSLVYFLAPIGGGPIKIGITKNPSQRFEYMQRHSPYLLELIACAPGGRELESVFHAMFCDHRLHGEWFSPDPRLLAECDKLAERWIG